MAPAFVDPASCRAWLDDVPLLNVGTANAMFQTSIRQFNSAPCPPARRLETLEVLRPRVVMLQDEHAKRFRGKPLPLSPQRRENLSEVGSLWDALAQGYERCIETLLEQHSDAKKTLATACQRVLDVVARKMRDHHHAYVEVSGADFRMLHRVFALAEREGVAHGTIKDPVLGEGARINCVRTYVSALLFEAARPREHRPMMLPVIERWLDRWSAKIGVETVVPEDLKIPPMHVDLKTSFGARRGEVPNSPSIRLIDVSGLATSLEKRIHWLRRGRRPEEIHLGNDLSRRDFEALLVAIYRQWCQVTPKRLHEREKVNMLAHVSTGVQAAHFYLTKRPFMQPSAAASFDHPTLPGEQRLKAATDYMIMAGISAEQWLIRDESVAGLGLVRPLHENNGVRLTHGGLLSVRPRGKGTLMIGSIQWMQESQQGDLHVGVRLVPGIPAGIAARAEDQERFAPAIMFAPIPTLNIPTSLVVPSGTYRARRVLHLHARSPQAVEVTGLLDAGPDYERVAFMPCGDPHAPT